MNDSFKRATIYDVAKAAGVGVATVSKALNDTGRVSQVKRDAIKQIAKDIGFRPNALARGLQSSRSFAVGLLTNDSYGRFTLPMMAGVSRSLVNHEISVFLSAIDEDDPKSAQAHVEALLDKRVDAIIATGKRGDRRLPVDLTGLNIPVVYAFAEGMPDAVTLLADDEQGARLAVEHLQAQGRVRIAHVTGPATFLAARQRAEAYRSLTGEPFPVVHGDWSEAHGHAAVDQLWQGATRPDAIFCGNDQIARGVADALRERGVRVPDEVAVVGFDNWEIVAAATRPPLTTVDMQLNELGRTAGQIVRALAEGEDVSPGIRKLPCRLVVRQSCGNKPESP